MQRRSAGRSLERRVEDVDSVVRVPRAELRSYVEVVLAIKSKLHHAGILTQAYYEDLRKQLLQRTIATIVNYRQPVFKAAVVDTCSLVIQNIKSAPGGEVTVRWDDRKAGLKTEYCVPQSSYESNAKKAFVVNADSAALGLRSRIDAAGTALGQIMNLNQAIALKSDRAKWLYDSAKGAQYKRVF